MTCPSVSANPAASAGASLVAPASVPANSGKHGGLPHQAPWFGWRLRQ